MRLSRRPVAALAVASLVVTAATLAAATTASSVGVTVYSSEVVAQGQLPHNGWSTASNCQTDPPYAAPAFDFVEGPGSAPAGRGSLEVATAGGGGIARVELPVFGLSALTLSTITAAYDVVAADDAFAGNDYASLLVTVQDPAYPDAWTYVSVAGGAPGAGWQSLDLLTSGVKVAVRAKADGSEVVPTATTTWGQFRAFTAGAMVVGATLATTCRVPTTVAWDDITISAAGVSTTYDLEPAVASTLSSGVSASTATYGGSATVTGSLVRDSGGTPIAGAEVELWAKPSGAAAFALLTTATSTAGGSLSATVRPTKATQYRWQLPAESAYTGPASAARTVSVRAALSLNKAASSVAYPAPVVLFGAAKPLPAGTTVTLRRGSTAIGTAALRSDGTFAFAKKLARGSYTFTVSVPAVAGYAAATSAKVSVTVS